MAGKSGSASRPKKRAGRGRPAEIRTARKLFNDARREAVALHDLGRALDQSRLTDELIALGFSRTKGRLLVSVGFLRLMGAWEHFVEGLFLRFLVGAQTPTGGPTLRGEPYPSLDQAFAKVSGKTGVRRIDDHLSWTRWATVGRRARKFFDQGEPFTSVLAAAGPDVSWYGMALAVRNRIAHPSDHATDNFIAAARDFLEVQRLRSGYMVGEFLLENSRQPVFDAKHASKDVFMATAGSMAVLADRLMK